MISDEASTLQPFVERLLRRSILSEVEQKAIIALPVRALQVGTNEDFVALGEAVNHSSFVVAGLVARFGQDSSGARQITALHIAGDMPNLPSVAHPAASSALQALAPTKLLMVRHSAIRAAAAEHPAIAEALWRDCMVDAGILAQWVVNLGRRLAIGRISHLLCQMASRYNAAPSSGKAKFHLPMTQQHLAEATGLTQIHVNRTLKRLATAGTRLRGNTAYIEDWISLVEVADFDPGYLQIDVAPEHRIRIIH